MARSNPTARVVRILDALQAQRGRGLRFAELARAADLSQGTCHAILGTLQESGYVVRDPEALTFTLGPALVALGEAAAASFADVRAAAGEVAALAARTRCSSSAAQVVDDSITVVEVAAPPGVVAPIKAGARVPFAPPFGAIHVAWDGDDAVDAWIARAPRPTLTRARLRRVIDDHRRTYLAVAPYTAASAELRAALGELAADSLASDVRRRTLKLLADIDELDYTSDVLANAEQLPVNTLTTPVFDRDGSTAFAVALHLGAHDVPMTRVRELGDELRDAGARITALIGGRTPDPERALVHAEESS